MLVQVNVSQKRKILINVLFHSYFLDQYFFGKVQKALDFVGFTLGAFVFPAKDYWVTS